MISLSIKLTLPNEIIQSLDILRGFALLGILLINIQLFWQLIFLIGLYRFDHLDLSIENAAFFDKRF